MASKTPTIEYHPSSSDPKVFNLRLRARNGEIVMQGTQGYTESNAKRAAARLKPMINDAEIAKRDA